MDLTRPLTPGVTAEEVSFEPLPEFAAEWWAADNAPVDLSIVVTADTLEDDSYFGRLGELVASAWERVTRWTNG
jgi:hypothetical protein